LPTELLVVLDASGEARHVWLVRSCGDPALDAAARRAVQLSRFGPSENGYRGVLRVVWGAGRKAS
jgi:TonB family protein